jgi:hypothetical protein
MFPGDWVGDNTCDHVRVTEEETEAQATAELEFKHHLLL